MESTTNTNSILTNEIVNTQKKKYIYIIDDSVFAADFWIGSDAVFVADFCIDSDAMFFF